MARVRPSLKNFWHPVASSEAVGTQPQGVRLLEQDLVLFRDTAGTVHAWRDLCVHRGTKLSLGRVENERLVCPYHGWQYDLEGKCAHIPSLGEGASIPAKARVEAYRAQDADGLVWVALDGPAVDLPRLVPEGEEGDWRLLVVTDGTPWAASAGRAAENSFDSTHAPFVHPGAFSDNPLAPAMKITDSPNGFKAEYPSVMRIGGEKVATENQFIAIEIPFLTDRWNWHDERGFGYGVRIVASPVSPKACRVFVVNVRNYDLEPEKDEGFREFSRTVIVEDQAIVESQRPEELPLRLRDELHLRVPDALALMYRRRLGELDADDVETYGLMD